MFKFKNLSKEKSLSNIPIIESICHYFDLLFIKTVFKDTLLTQRVEDRGFDYIQVVENRRNNNQSDGDIDQLTFEVEDFLITCDDDNAIDEDFNDDESMNINEDPVNNKRTNNDIFNGELKLYDVFKNAREMACLYHEDDNNIYAICENIEKLFELLQNKLNTMNVRNGAKTIERRKERFRCIYFNMIATYLMIANRFTNSQIDAIRKIIR